MKRFLKILALFLAPVILLLGMFSLALVRSGELTPTADIEAAALNGALSGLSAIARLLRFDQIASTSTPRRYLNARFAARRRPCGAVTRNKLDYVRLWP